MKTFIKTTTGIISILMVLCCSACGNSNSNDTMSAAAPVISETAEKNADMRFVGTWKIYFKNDEQSGMTFGKYEDDLLEIYEDNTGKYLISGESIPVTWTSKKDTITIKSEKASTDYVLKDGRLSDPNEDGKVNFGQTVAYYEKQS